MTNKQQQNNILFYLYSTGVADDCIFQHNYEYAVLHWTHAMVHWKACLVSSGILSLL